MKNVSPIVYVQLLNEGTKVYRPVSAVKIDDNVFELGGFEIHDPADEDWEFLPGSCVIVEEKELSGRKVLVAVKEFIK